MLNLSLKISIFYQTRNKLLSSFFLNILETDQLPEDISNFYLFAKFENRRNWKKSRCGKRGHPEQIREKYILTNNREIHDVSKRWCSSYLTFVSTAVFPLRVSDFQCPIFRLWRMYRCEPLVARIREPVHRQQMDSTMAYPWYL